VIVLDDAERVRDYNAEAEDLFPSLEVGDAVAAALPELAAPLDADGEVLEVDRAGGMRYYQLSVNPFAAGTTGIGRAITLADITDREQYRREIERQNERLSQFASMVSHDLRNPLGVAIGRVELAREEGDSEHLDTARTALARMESLIEDLLTLARHGQPIDETERVSLSTVADPTREVVETGDATLSVEADLALLADPDRLQQLLENLFRNSVEHGSTGSRATPDDSVEHGSTGNRTESGDSVEHGGTAVTVRVGALPEADGFYVEDDGPGIPESARDEVFEAGHTTAEDGTGFGLAIVKEIVDAHGWEIRVADADGARFEITGVTVDPD
jgi:signal transduction histidine kinase